MSNSWWPRMSRAETLAFTAILLLALGVRLIGISTESFWVDEAASWVFSRMPLAELWGNTAFEPHPPLYYTILKFWSWVFGNSEAALRSLSTLVNLVTVFLVFHIGRLVLEGKEGFWLGLVAAGLIAVHPVQIHYAQEARGYAMLVLGATMVLLALTWWLKHPEALSKPPLETLRTATVREWQVMCLFVFGAALAFWMNHTAVLLLGSVIAVAAIVLIIDNAGRRGATVANFAMLAVVILVLWAPAVPRVFSGLDKIQSGFWLLAPSIYGVIQRLDYLFGSATYDLFTTARDRVIAICCVGLLVAAGAAALIHRGKWRIALLLAAAALLPAIVSLIATFTFTPIFIPRPLIWVQIGYMLLAAASVLWIRSIPARSVVLAGALVALTSFALTHRATKEPWRQIVEVLQEQSQPNDLIITWYNYAQVPLEYYDAANRVPARRLPLWKSDLKYPTMADVLMYDNHFDTDEVMERVREAERNSAHIWVIVHGSTNDVIVKQIYELLATKRGQPEVKFDYQLPSGMDAHIHVARYEVAGSPVGGD